VAEQQVLRQADKRLAPEEADEARFPGRIARRQPPVLTEESRSVEPDRRMAFPQKAARQPALVLEWEPLAASTARPLA